MRLTCTQEQVQRHVAVSLMEQRILAASDKLGLTFAHAFCCCYVAIVIMITEATMNENITNESMVCLLVI